MLTQARTDIAARLPGPAELLPGCPDAVIDLQTDIGAELVDGEWRYSDARVTEIDFVDVGHPDDPLGPGLEPNRTFDVEPHAEATDFDDCGWRVLKPAETQRRLSQGRVCFNWYRIAVTIPERVGEFDPTGASVVFEVVVDDHAEVWVNGELPHALGDADGHVVSGAPDGALLFSSPNTNVIYRWHRSGRVSVFRSKSGYNGVDIGRFAQPGSNGLTFDRDGRLTICQHGNRRVIRVEPHGNVTVLADHFDGRRPNSPNDLVYSSDGTLFFTDPPFGLPGVFDDPDKELPFSGVFSVRPDGAVILLTDELEGPNGLAFSPDERYLYVGNWDPECKVVMRYELGYENEIVGSSVLFDMTDAPGEDAIDGIKVDEDGNVYACGPGGVWIISPDGAHLGTLRLPESPHNLAWGDADGRTLYVAAVTSIYRIRLRIPGIRPQ